MAATLALVTALVLGCQEDASKWIEKLRSEQVEERERASAELKKLGNAAIPELEKVSGDRDVEVAARARTLIRMIRFREIFGIEPKDLNSIPATDLVDWMTKKTGRKFIYSEGVGLNHRRFRFQEDLFELGDAYALGVALLRTADLAVTPSDGVPGTSEIVPAPIAGKKALKVCKSVDELPKADEFCTLVLQPRHVSPRSAQALLINIVSFPQNCLSVEDSGTLILSDYPSVLRKCAEIVRSIDASRVFRVHVTLLEGRRGTEASLPDEFKNLRLTEATGLNRFTVSGTAAAKLERALPQPVPGIPGGAGKTVLRFSGYTVEFGASVRASGGPTLERFTVLRDGEKPLLETMVGLKDENWTFVGSIPTDREGGALVIVARAVPE